MAVNILKNIQINFWKITKTDSICISDMLTFVKRLMIGQNYFMSGRHGLYNNSRSISDILKVAGNVRVV